MTVTVIIPTFNGGQFLAEALASIRGQTWTDWECVVIDDGSTDRTRRVAGSFTRLDGRIKYIRQENRGVSDARNVGLAATQGDFVQFLDADDYLGVGKLARQLELFEHQPEADIVYGGVRYFSDVDSGQGRTVRQWIARSALRPVSGAGDSVIAALVRDNVMVVEAPLVRRVILERAGGFDPSLRRLEDWECWLRCAEAGANFFHDRFSEAEALSYVRLHPGSLSDDQLKMVKAALPIREEMKRRLHTQELRRLNDLRVHEQWAEIGVLEGLGNHPAAGVRWLVRASLAERRVKWLVWGLLIPALRLPPGRWALSEWRRFKSRRIITATPASPDA